MVIRKGVNGLDGSLIHTCALQRLHGKPDGIEDNPSDSPVHHHAPGGASPPNQQWKPNCCTPCGWPNRSPPHLQDCLADVLQSECAAADEGRVELRDKGWRLRGVCRLSGAADLSPVAMEESSSNVECHRNEWCPVSTRCWRLECKQSFLHKGAGGHRWLANPWRTFGMSSARLCMFLASSSAPSRSSAVDSVSSEAATAATSTYSMRRGERGSSSCKPPLRLNRALGIEREGLKLQRTSILTSSKFVRQCLRNKS